MASDNKVYQKQEVKDFARTALEEMTAYARIRFKIPKFDPKMTISFNSQNYVPYGGHMDGKPILFIPMHPILWMVGRKNATKRFPEYDQFKKDPEIGTIQKASWKQWVTTAIAHEISHAIQYYAITHPKICSYMLEPYLHTDAEEHGLFWRDIYRGFRVRFVNNFVF